MARTWPLATAGCNMSAVQGRTVSCSARPGCNVIFDPIEVGL